MTDTWKPATIGKGAWARRNLFNNRYNTILTLILGGGVIWVSSKLILLAIGLDYEIVRRNLLLFMIGSFPRDQLARPYIALILFAWSAGMFGAASAASALAKAIDADLPHRHSSPQELIRRFWPLLALVVLLLAFTRTLLPMLLAMVGVGGGVAIYFLTRSVSPRSIKWAWLGALTLGAAGFLGLVVGIDGAWNSWGGFHVNLFLAIAGIVLAFPFGLLLALGRRSSLPVIRYLSVTYIEFIRGVPLITLLLMGVFALGFFLPEALRPGQMIRVLVAIVIFESAYVAEVVRGGLQAVPKGQLEAGQALGLSPWKNTRLIILPQALRATIPAMVGQFISLFKDTTLVNLVGISDLLDFGQTVNSQPDFVGKRLFFLTLSFAGMLFWVGSYTMSREAKRLETKLGVGER